MIKKRNIENIENKTINIFDKDDMANWCILFDCEKEKLIEAILTVGSSAKKVHEFLKVDKKK